MFRTPPKSQLKATASEPASDSQQCDVVEQGEPDMNPPGRLGAVTRKMNEIKPYMSIKSMDNLTKVKGLLEEYDEKVGNFQEACSSELSKELDVNKQLKLKSYLETALQTIRTFRDSVVQWMHICNDKTDGLTPARKGSNNEGSILSAISNGSLVSNSSSLRLKLIEKKIQNENKQKKILEHSAIKKQQLKLQLEAEELDVKYEAQEIKQLEAALDSYDQFYNQGAIPKKAHADERTTLNINKPVVDGMNDQLFSKHTNTFKSVADAKQTAYVQDLPVNYDHRKNVLARVPCDMSGSDEVYNEENFQTRDNKKQDNAPLDNLTLLMQKQTDISEMIAKNQIMSQLPKLEPETFDGTDITKYNSFILSFEQTIANKCSNYSDLYYFLQKYTVGKPFELVKSCKSNDPHSSYLKARDILKVNYGNQIRITQKYIDKLNKWPVLRSEDEKGLEDFSIFLNSCYNILEYNNNLNSLNSWEKIYELVMKLPYDLRKQFRHIVNNNEKYERETVFETFVKFINDQISLLKIPLFGNIKDEKSLKNKPQRTFRTNLSDSYDTDNDELCNLNSEVQLKCPFCLKNNHELDSCFFFVKKSVDERERFVRQNKLCFGCLKTTNHQTRYCPKRIICKQCKKMHPTSLHRNYPENKNNDYRSTEFYESNNDKNTANYEINNDCREASFSVIDRITRGKLTCPTVPVKLRVNNSNEFIYTYMAMDTQSTGCYIDEALISRLGYKGKKTTLNLKTMDGYSNNVDVELIKDLSVQSLDGEITEIIPKLYAKAPWPFERHDSPTKNDVEKYVSFKDIPFEFIDEKIGLLVGINVPQIVKPLELVNTTRNGPYATKHLFGWALNGPVKGHQMSKLTCLRSIHNEVTFDRKIEQCFSREFSDDSLDNLQPSINDLKFLEIAENTIKVTESNNYEIALPFKENVFMPDNYSQIYGRLMSSKRKLLSNDEHFVEYCKFMKLMRDNDFIEKVPDNSIETSPGKRWYLTHHSVRHKQKGKIRIVFDCSLKFQNVSLNDKLFQGPDLTNNLIGVLLRFREEKVAFSADIEKMFYQVKVPEADRDFLRFLWFPNDDLTAEPVQYRLKVHVFGARSSPSCANFALRHIATDIDNLSSMATDSILNSFYVDDLLKSVATVDDAQSLVTELQNSLASRSFNLTEFTSNDDLLLKSISKDKLSKKLKLNLFKEDSIQNERALGVLWNIENDTLCFNIEIKNNPRTKRGLLSSIFSIYDPMFLISPVIVCAKRIFQKACYLKLGWDEPLNKILEKAWENWLNQMDYMKNYEIPRCIKTIDRPERIELHIFCDGSEVAYGSVAYLRCIRDNNISSEIIMAKVRMTPLNRDSLKTIPRIELNAAKLAVSLYLKLKSEIDTYSEPYFWTDSKIVLCYIKSENARYQRFVHNRVSYIRSHSQVDQWNYVSGKLNPADLLSRGVTDMKVFLEDKLWKHGPPFLTQKDLTLSKTLTDDINYDDLEIKRNLMTMNTTMCSVQKLIESTSSWLKLIRRIAAILRIKDYLKHQKRTYGDFSMSELRRSEVSLWKYLQNKVYGDEIKTLSKNKILPYKHSLTKLTPFIDSEGLLRVGGRLDCAPIPYEFKHPPILPKNEHAVTIYVEHVHKNIGHMGKESLISNVKQNLHVMGLNSTVKSVLRNCLTCKKINGRPSNQLMSSLPVDRITGDMPPFSYVGLDYFGPFLVSKGRCKAQEKRYGVVISCLTTRAVHLEISHSLNTDSFINALRRFIARRGSVKLIRSDNGTNLVSGNKELRSSLNELNQSAIYKFCQVKNVEWKFQPPAASHFGGVFEREIRTVRKIMHGLLSEFANQLKLTDDFLNTLMCEIEDIMNNRPLTAADTDENDLDPLTPNHLLRVNCNVSFPPGIFSKDDLLSRRQWRQIQYLSDVFWSRWKKEYIPLLRLRQKWHSERRSVHSGDLILLVDQNMPRNMWCTGRVIDVKRDGKGVVRSAKVKVSKCKLNGCLQFGSTTLERPIDKLILLRSYDEL